MKNDPKVIVALDFNEQAALNQLVDKLSPEQCRLKIGKELFTLFGPEIVEKVQAAGFEVFLDLKFHDIPQTVAKACAAAASLGVWMVNVHALGGEKMMSYARNALDKAAHQPKLIAVTILTSMDEDAFRGVGLSGSIPDRVESLASLAANCGLDGVVCSAQEATQIKQGIDKTFLTVTPGIRPDNYDVTDDQSRIMTPQKAIQAGSDYLVVGRPITQADNPATVLAQINQSIGL